MKIIITLLLLISLTQVSQAEKEQAKQESTAPPGSEIVLASLTVKNGQVTISNPENITASKGYDSQPVFMEQNQAIYFTKFVKNQTDIYRYDIKSGETTAYTQTPESEYSATPMPRNKGISVVRVDLDKSQNVYWLHKDKTTKVNDIDNVGYINWTGKNKLWMFVINDEIGNLYYQAKNKKPKQMASNIGRAIKVDTKSKNLYYVDKSSDFWWINKISTKKFKQHKVLALPKGVEDFSIDSAGNFWCGRGNTLFYSDSGKNWMLVKEFNMPNLSNITRIDVNSELTQIAITFGETNSK